MNEPEQWRPVVGWEGLYEVSSLGRVRSVDRVVPRLTPRGDAGFARYRSRILRPKAIDKYGHQQVCFSRIGERRMYFVHALVLIAFAGARPDGQQVAHLDGNPRNNRLDNLKWATPKENQAHRIGHGTHDRGEKNTRHKLTRADVQEIRRLAGRLSVAEIAERFSASHINVANIIKGKARQYD